MADPDYHIASALLLGPFKQSVQVGRFVFVMVRHGVASVPENQTSPDKAHTELPVLRPATAKFVVKPAEINESLAFEGDIPGQEIAIAEHMIGPGHGAEDLHPPASDHNAKEWRRAADHRIIWPENYLADTVLM